MRNLILDMLASIRLLALTIILDAEQAIDIVCTDQRVRRYLRGLGAFATIAMLFPIIPSGVGIIGGLPWLTSIAGLWCALWSIILFTWATPIGVLIDALFHASSIERPGKGFVKSVSRVIEGSGRRYLRFVLGVLFIELAITWVAAVLPLRANMGNIPIFIVVVALLFVSAEYYGVEGTLRRKIIRGLVILTLIGVIFSFLAPDISSAVAYRMTIKQKSVAKEIMTNGIPNSLKGLVPTNWFASSSVNTSGVVVYRAVLGETNEFIPNEAGMAELDGVKTNRFSGWIHIPPQWPNFQWQGAGKGIFVQGLGHENEPPLYVDPRGTRVIPWRVFRVKYELGEGKLYLARLAH